MVFGRPRIEYSVSGSRRLDLERFQLGDEAVAQGRVVGDDDLTLVSRTFARSPSRTYLARLWWRALRVVAWPAVIVTAAPSRRGVAAHDG